MVCRCMCGTLSIEGNAAKIKDTTPFLIPNVIRTLSVLRDGNICPASRGLASGIGPDPLNLWLWETLVVFIKGMDN